MGKRCVFIMKRVLSLFLILILIVMLSVSCKADSKTKADSLLGVWILSMKDLDSKTASFFSDGSTTSYEFKSDGTGILTIFSVPLGFTYTVNGNKLNLVLKDENDEEIREEYTYKIENNKLSFKTGEYNMVFNKQ